MNLALCEIYWNWRQSVEKQGRRTRVRTELTDGVVVDGNHIPTGASIARIMLTGQSMFLTRPPRPNAASHTVLAS